MGFLGSTAWYRCRQCGTEYYRSVADDMVQIKLSTHSEPIAMFSDAALPITDLDEGATIAEQEYGHEWEYVCNDDETITRLEWIGE